MFKDFYRLKEALIFALILHPAIWDEAFELICDASDYALRVVLTQDVNRKSYVIYYAKKSHNLNEAQLNYTIIEKEFLVVVFGAENSNLLDWLSCDCPY